MLTGKKKLIFFMIWLAITVSIQLFGYSVMEYLKYIIGPYNLRLLSGGVGIFVSVFFVGVVLHYCIHRLTSPDN